MQLSNASRIQYRVVDVDTNSLCNIQEKYTYFPDKHNFFDGTNLCKRFGGRRVDVSTRLKVQEVVKFLFSVKDDVQFSDSQDISTGTMYTDHEVTNVWREFETGQPPLDPFQWFYAEPNGGLVENCAEIWAKEEGNKRSSGFNDESCASARPTACQDIGLVKLTLRGKLEVFPSKSSRRGFRSLSVD